MEKLLKKVLGRIDTYPNPQVNSLDKNPFIIGEKLAGHLLSIIKEKGIILSLLHPIVLHRVWLRL